MARRKHSNRRRRRGSSGFLYKLLSILAICGCVVAALTLFFRVDAVVITGQQRYTDQQIRDASGIESGDNLFLLNKYDAAQNILDALPYIKKIRMDRKLPDTLLIEIEESGMPLALIQEGSVWLISASGKIVEQKDPAAVADYGIISGCTLLAPSVGTQIALSAERIVQQESLLALLNALEEAGMLEDVDSIRLHDESAIYMDYIGRFTVKMPYGADYPVKMKILKLALESEQVQENMTGTFDMMREDGRTYLDQSTR